MFFSILPTNTLSVRSTNNPFSNTPGILLIHISISFGFLIPSANSNSIYNLIKIPNLEIYELKTPNKLKYFYATKPFRLGVQKNISCINSDKKTYDVILEKLKIFGLEKYFGKNA